MIEILNTKFESSLNSKSQAPSLNSKSQAPNYKQYQMIKILNSKHYDLEERTYRFAEKCRDFVKKSPRTIANIEYGKQLIRSSGS